MANIKEQIISWFNGPQDYDQGLKLLQLVSKKNKVIGKLAKRGETRGSIEKLVWELNKVAGLKKIPAPKGVKAPGIKGTGQAPQGEKPKKVKTEKEKKEDDGKPKFNLIGKNELDSYPREVKRLVKEYSSLYMQRGKKHAALKRLGDGNDQETIDKRKVLIDEIAEMQVRLELFYKAFNDYEKEGIQPDVNVLWPTGNTGSGSTGTIGDVGINIEDLKNMKKNIQSSITKDRNSLLYGGKTKPKDGKEKPMPAGPKRTTLEKRINRKEKEIGALDQRIADMG